MLMFYLEDWGVGPSAALSTPLPPRLYTCRPLDATGSTALRFAITASPIQTTLLWACTLFHILDLAQTLHAS